MSKFLIGEGASISVEGTEYKADKRGVVEVPDEHETLLVNRHGLTLFLEAPKDADKAPEAPKKAGKTADKAPEAATEAAV